MILTTKLRIPSLRHNLLPRPRLRERLDQGLHRKLMVVSAPAGFGKTTLLAEWIQSLHAGDSPPVQVGWISLDSGDNDPARFSAYLTAALRPAGARLGQAGENAFEVGGTVLRESHLVGLINQMATLPQAFLLVLDDYHVIESQVIHDAVTFLIDHQSENLHLALVTRADPPLPLALLRARNQLIELRQDDLRFTAEEAAAFLNEIMGLRLSPEDVTALEARTEGWIAGLQMAALSLQGRDDARSLVQSFTGSHRFILDFLVEEVLERQQPVLQTFLLQTSILDRLSGPLCDAVVEIRGPDERVEGDTFAGIDLPAGDSQSVLERLEAANLFIVPLDDERRWYRYHRLFADLLRNRLRQTSPELVPALHRRASAWYEQQGLAAAAIDHALAAHDFDRAANLIEDNVEATLMRSEVMTFLNWAEKLPGELVRSHPGLCFYHALALLMSGRSLDTVGQRLQDLRSAGAVGPEHSGAMAGRMAALNAYFMVLQADTERAAALCRQALDQLPENSRFLRSLMTWILSLARVSTGDLEDGRQALAEVARIGQEIGNPLIAVGALCHQARVQMRQGQLHRARETLERALQLATDPRGGRLPVASEALIGLGELELEWNNLDKAAAYLTESIDLAGRWSELAAFDAYFPLARIKLAQGDDQAARQALETARQIARRSEATTLDDLVADLQQAYFDARQGDVASAMNWAQEQGLIPGALPERRREPDQHDDLIRARLRKYEHLLLARLYILQGRAAEALDLLESLLALARQLGRIDLMIEIQILTALAHQVEGHDALAQNALAEALALAEPGGHLRVFLDEGEPMAELLRRSASRGVAPAYVARLTAAFGGAEPAEMAAEPSTGPARPLIEPLSERELEVLRLIADGLSNREIAQRLVISLPTVKWHTSNIYGKLEVRSRTQAVAHARSAGILPPA